MPSNSYRPLGRWSLRSARRIAFRELRAKKVQDMMCENHFSALQFLVVAILSGVLVTGVNAQRLIPAGEARPAWQFSGNPTPRWSGGFLIPIDNQGYAAEKPVIQAFDDTGQEAEPLVFSIPNARSILVDAVARASNGTWAVGGRAYDAEGKGGGFISWVSPDQRHVTTVKSYPYDVGAITIAPDGTTWTYGYEIAYGREYYLTHDGVIRHFDKSGKQIGSYIPRISIRDQVDSPGMMNGRLVCNGDRVGWYAAQAHVYFELTYNGGGVSGPVSFPGIVGHNSSDAFITGLAMMDNSDVDATGQITRPEQRGALYRLDRASHSWTEVPPPDNLDGYVILLGGDGKRIAMYGGNRVVFFTPQD